MNLNKIRPKNERKDLLLTITENCETLIKQTRTRAEETSEFKQLWIKRNISFQLINSN